eukprot:292955_1
MASEKQYVSLATEPDIALADMHGISMKSEAKTNDMNASLSQSTPLLDDLSLSSQKYRAPEHTLSNKNVKRREQKMENQNIRYSFYDHKSFKYIFRPYRCCMLLILPISFSIAMVFVNEIESLTCTDCDTLYFQCDYIHQYTCHMKTIEGCCYDVDDLLFCQTYRYDSPELHHNTIIMRDLRYAISICEDVSYAVFIAVIFVITVIYVILEKCLKISLVTNVRNYDKIFLIAWIFTSIMLTIPLYFYFSPSYLKCSNWNEHHENDGENILPSPSDESKWSIGATLWMSIGSFCQIWLIGFCGCTFNKGVDFDSKNFDVDINKFDDSESDENNYSLFSQKLHSLRAYFIDNREKTSDDSQE